MNQAFGGAFLIKIALLFLAIYIFILGFAINYAKVFTVKNRIINLIEQYEGFDEGDEIFMGEIKTEITKLHYQGIVSDDIPGGDCVNLNYRRYYCIERFEASNDMFYYKVRTYIQFDIPVVKEVAVGIIPITGETRYMYEFGS